MSRGSTCSRPFASHAVAERDGIDAERAIQRRQLEWCIVLADGGEPRYWRRGTPWLDRVEPELANVRAALDFAHAEDDVEGEARLAGAMRHFWRVRGHAIEGRHRLEVALEGAGSVEPLLRARVLAETAVMRGVAGEYDGARALWLAALEIYTELGETVETGRMFSELGYCSIAVGDVKTAISYYEQARDALADEDFVLQIVLGNLAEAYEQTGDLEHARETALEVLEAQRRSGDRDGVAFTSFTLASIALAAADLDEASRRLVDCLAIAEEVGYVELTAYALGLAAALALALSSYGEGAQLIGAARELLRQIGVTPQAIEAARHAGVMEALNDELDNASSLIEGGAELDVHTAVALATGLGSAIAGSGGPAR